MRELIEEVFARHLGADELDVLADAAPIELNSSEVLITTDGFTVQPLEFPGGDIGGLAVHGTTNDLAVAGAKPVHKRKLSAAWPTNIPRPSWKGRCRAAAQAASGAAAGP